MAHAVSGHKCQGATLDSATVTHFGRCNGRKVRLLPGWMYVALSRVCTLADLLLGDELNADMFRRRPDMELEFARLEALDVQTKIFVSGSTPELEAQTNAADVKVNGLQREFENQERARMEKSGGKKVHLHQGKHPSDDNSGRVGKEQGTRIV